MIIIEHVNGRCSHVIPDGLCDIDLFVVSGCDLILSTGRRMTLMNEENAHEAWCVIERCLRKGGDKVLISEAPDGGAMGFY